MRQREPRACVRSMQALGRRLDDKLLLAAQPRDKRVGGLLLRVLAAKITQNSVDDIAVSHERFSKPSDWRA